MSSSNLLKNIISKDKNLSENTIKTIIQTNDANGFKEICEKSSFIFPFLREKIINNFVKFININNLNTIFEFSKIYSYDFEDIIVKSWLKFANEDLTDKILELFETGDDNQKAYCAKYFCSINDSLAIEYLEKNLYSDFEPLRINSAKALQIFKQDNVIKDVKNKILSLDNEFDKLPLYQILSVWKNKENIKFVIDNGLNSPYSGNIISDILDYNEFFELKNILDSESIFKIFNVLLENYPENIELNTIIYYQIYDFTEYLLKNITPYSKNLLALAKKQFLEYEQSEIYNFDLDKDTKEELKRICNVLKTFQPDFKNLKEELNSDSFRFETALKVIQEYNVESMGNSLADLINSSDITEKYKALIAQTLKKINKTNLINKKIVENIKNDNIRALISDLM